ncbi:unnamed protein product, partial [Didymodactylos carnosus]
TPYPFLICHCLTDTKTAGVYNCNIMDEKSTFKIQQGKEYVKVYQVKLTNTEKDKGGKDENVLSKHQRYFCSECGSYLWAYNEDYKN